MSNNYLQPQYNQTIIITGNQNNLMNDNIQPNNSKLQQENAPEYLSKDSL
jgi:hypothetical protein